jgi:hypothetical protein
MLQGRDEVVKANTERMEAAWLGISRMDEAVEAQTGTWLLTLLEAGWVFQGLCSC